LSAASERFAAYAQLYETNKRLRRSAFRQVLERARGIEPLYEAWEASVLPLNYARAGLRRTHNNGGRAEGEALGAAVINLHRRHSGRRVSGDPESITTSWDYGFRVRGLSPAPRNDRGERLLPYTSFTFFSGRLRTGLPVAAKIAFSTAGAATQIVGSPTPPQKSLVGTITVSTLGNSASRIIS
jgi:hypothetical protein